MKLLIALIVAALAAVALSAPLAPAAKPTREPQSFSDRTFSGQCEFDVHRHILVNRSIKTTFSDGRELLTGTFKQVLTNLDTGETLLVNASGPVLTIRHQDGTSTEYGKGTQFIRPPGELLLTSGPNIVERDASGAIVSFTQVAGRVQDVCELLG